MVFAIEKFQYYISNKHRFRVITDHSAIGQLLKAKEPKGPMARWIIKLSQYDFEVVYRPGRENVVADFLSRFPINEMSNQMNPDTVASLFVMPIAGISELQQNDGICRPIIDTLLTCNDKVRSRSLYYTLKEGILYRKVVRNIRPHLLLVIPKVLESAVLA